MNHPPPSDGTRRLIDLSHKIAAGVGAYPGFPQPVLTDHITREESRSMYAPGTEFHIGRICMMGQTGTYLDVPFHRYANGYDLARLDLGKIVDVPVTIIDTEAKAIPADAFAGAPIAGHAVLIRTGWSRFWGTELYGSGQHPYLSGDAARLLAAEGPSVVGIDSLNIDDTGDLTRPAHSEILGAGIPIVEHLSHLADLAANGSRFTAVPVKIEGLGTFPVRAFATCPA